MNTTNYARIIGTRHTIQLGPSSHRCYHTFKWEGGSTWPVEIGNELLHEIGVLSFPWPLVKIKECYDRDTVIFVRGDVAGGWWAKFCVVRALLSQRLKWIKCRVIITAMVWDWAWVPSGTEPQWSHIGKKRREV